MAMRCAQAQTRSIALKTYRVEGKDAYDLIPGRAVIRLPPQSRGEPPGQEFQPLGHLGTRVRPASQPAGKRVPRLVERPPPMLLTAPELMEGDRVWWVCSGVPTSVKTP